MGISEVTVRCLGDFGLHVDGTPVNGWRAGKARNLFQYLLMNRGRLVRRETLFETLWPDGEWSPSTSLLKVAMHSVRRTLEQAGISAARFVDVVSRDHGYLLRTGDGIRIDLDEFDASMAAGRAAEARGDHAVAVAAYGRAAELYVGDFLAAESADWITAHRQCYRTLVLYALTYLRADALRRGDHAAVIELCRRILEIDPYHEEMYQTLMLLHGQRGELGQVRNWHRLCVQRLRDDLELPPSETTRRIFHRAVRGELRSPAPAIAGSVA
ncbi:MAG TPA: BTAD domain-containing putative transcriptional regulator [Actinophytocola sp.]|uniref:AfsR/SARP family transcriptional regulator n=1 Tax=Actinophytocola sp. TaxID=1872138 RepID=UPI002DDD7365|nr:BTAD domain-containing putative transcriptional regulator [Actinophytocola sp.]HEV2783341.1 BTAD domain-containing putative transcriptional regulator [Actinophytocola sp.]